MLISLGRFLFVVKKVKGIIYLLQQCSSFSQDIEPVGGYIT